MKKLRLMTIVGTRPEIIRLSEVIKKADRFFDHIFVHTGQNWAYELNEIFFKDLNLRSPDVCLNAVGKDLGETLGNIVTKSYHLLLEKKPDALLVLGDTNSCLSTLSAKRLKIPIFHMEAGNRCFDQNLPEELNRKVVDHISDINLAYSEHSRRYLLMEGIKKDTVFVTGSPMREVINHHMEKITKSQVLKKLDLQKSRYILISAHREENIDQEKNFFPLMEAINAIAEHYQLPLVYSLHPRSEKLIRMRNFKFHSKVRCLKPFSFSDYTALQKNAFVVISDSGTLSEESAILNFTGVLLRTSTERPEAIDQGTIVIGGIIDQEIINAINMVRSFFDENKSDYTLPQDYKSLNVSEKVIKIIQSYTKIINQFVWFKN